MDEITKVPSLPHEPVVTNTHTGSGGGGSYWKQEFADKRVEELYARLEYCEQQNGRPDCKNCGLTRGMIDKALTKYHQDVMSEVVEKLEGMKKLATMQIPDGGMLAKALDEGDSPTIVWHYKNTITDIYNQALTEAQNIIK